MFKLFAILAFIGFSSFVSALDVTLDYNTIVNFEHFNYLGVRSGPFYEIIYTPVKDFVLTKIVWHGFTFFEAAAGESALDFHLILNFTLPFIAYFTVQLPDGSKKVRYFKKCNGWAETTKEIYDGIYNRDYPVELNFSDKVTLDINAVDENKFLTNASDENGHRIFNISPLNGTSIGKIVDGEHTIWETSSGDVFGYYSLIYSVGDRPLLCRVHIVDKARFNHKLFIKTDGQWGPVSLPSYIENLRKSAFYSRSLDIASDKHDDVSIVEGARFGVDYKLFTPSLYRNLDKVHAGGQVLYERQDKQHCSHVAVHYEAGLPTHVHLIVVSFSSSEIIHNFFKKEGDKFVTVAGENFPENFKFLLN